MRMLAPDAEGSEAVKRCTQREQAKRLTAAFPEKTDRLRKSLVCVRRRLVELGKNDRIFLPGDRLPDVLRPITSRCPISGQRASFPINHPGTIKRTGTVDHLGYELPLMAVDEGRRRAIHQDANFSRQRAQ